MGTKSNYKFGIQLGKSDFAQLLKLFQSNYPYYIINLSSQAYYRSTQGIIVVYDTNNPTSFTNARHWLEQINQSTGPNIQKALVGNKSDLVRMVQSSEGQALADEFRIPFLECSAKEGDNIEQVFMDMGRSIYNERKNNPNRDDTLELGKKKS